MKDKTTVLEFPEIEIARFDATDAIVTSGFENTNAPKTPGRSLGSFKNGTFTLGGFQQ